MEPSKIRALCYADVFSFPLKRKELAKFEIRSSNIKTSTKSKIHKAKYETTSGYYFLKGRQNIVTVRKAREQYTNKKLQVARRVLKLFCKIPTIMLIAVTGTVAAGNARENDDTDIFIISKTNWLWTTRFLVVALASLLGIRRKPHDKNVADKLCFNMYCDSMHMTIPENEQDEFSANEIARMKILWGREETEEKFYYQNRWVKNYLPNFQFSIINNQIISNNQQSIFNPVEVIFKYMQLFIMRGKRTNEVISDGYLRFHPRDARVWILKQYHKRLRQYRLE